MKRILTALALTMTAVSASAHGYGHYEHHRGGWGYGWVAPAVIGGVIGYEIARPAPVVVQQPTVIVQPTPQGRTGFFCSTSGYFYPQVQTCSVPWQQVSY